MAVANASPNVEVYFVLPDQMLGVMRTRWNPDITRAIAGDLDCVAATRSNDSGAIHKAIVVINIKQRAEAGVAHCLLEKIVNPLGLGSDTDADPRPSIFSEWDAPHAISYADTLLIRALYAPDMQPGTPKASARSLALRFFSQQRLDATEWTTRLPRARLTLAGRRAVATNLPMDKRERVCPDPVKTCAERSPLEGISLQTGSELDPRNVPRAFG